MGTQLRRSEQHQSSRFKGIVQSTSDTVSFDTQSTVASIAIVVWNRNFERFWKNGTNKFFLQSFNFVKIYASRKDKKTRETYVIWSGLDRLDGNIDRTLLFIFGVGSFLTACSGIWFCFFEWSLSDLAGS